MDGINYYSPGIADGSFFTCKIKPSGTIEWKGTFGQYPYNYNNLTLLHVLGSAVDNFGCIYNVVFHSKPMNLQMANNPLAIPVYVTSDFSVVKICETPCVASTTTNIYQNANCFYNYNGQTLTASGAYPTILPSYNNCDSIVVLNLNLLTTGVSDTTFVVIDSCIGGYIFNGITYTNSGLYSQYYVAANLCDSIKVLDLTIAIFDTLNMLVCDSLAYNNVVYSSTGQYNQFINNPNGCDTNLTLNLTVHYSQFDTTYATSCINYTFNGITYNTSGVFYQYYVGANQCDSNKVLYLTILQPSSSTLIQTACDSFSLNGITYTNSGLYTQTFTNAVGCDSTLYLYLTINSIPTINIVDTACQSYIYNGINYTASGLYYDTIQVLNGCDTLITLNLTIYQNPLLSVFPFTDTTVCIGTSYMLYADSNFVSNQWTLNGNIVSYDDSLLVNSSGTYILTCADTNGCYASDTVNIIMMPAPQPIIVQNGFVLTCTNVDSVSYQWFWNNNSIGTNDSTLSLTQNGTYVVFTTDSSGCIGIDTLIVSGVGLDSYTMNEHIQFYPNPTTSLINIESATPLTDATIRIYDMTGALLQQQVNLKGSKFQLNLTQYANGLYHIEIKNNGIKYNTKVLKE